MNRLKMIVSLPAILFAFSAFADDIICKGKVVSADDLEPLTGVTVMIDNPRTIASSDIKGNFTIKVPEGSILKLMYIGCETQTIKAKPNLGTITMQMSEVVLENEDPEPAPTPEEVDKWVDEGLKLYKEKRYEEAFRKFRDAAMEDNARAECMLAVCYRDGLGTKKNEQEYRIYMFASAKHGYAAAQYVMGILYRDGNGVPRNLKLAEEYLRKAAAQGDNDAKIALYDLTSGN